MSVNIGDTIGVSITEILREVESKGAENFNTLGWFVTIYHRLVRQKKEAGISIIFRLFL